MTDYNVNGLMTVPGLLVDSSGNYGVVWSPDGTFKIVADPFSTAQKEVFKADTSGGTITMGAGTGSATATLEGVLNITTTTASTTTTSKQTLASYSMPANTLSANGKGILINTWYSSAANGNSKTATIDFNGVSVATVNTSTTSSVFQLNAIILRTGAAAETYIGNGTAGIVTSTPTQATTTADTTTSLTIAATATTGSATGDLTFQGMVVRVLN